MEIRSKITLWAIKLSIIFPIMNSKIPTICTPKQPQKPTIAWDLHGVVIRHDAFKMAFKIIINYKFAQALKQLVWPPNKNTFKQTYSLLQALWRLIKEEKNCSSERYIHIARDHNNTPLAELIQEATYNNREAIQGTVAIIHELHKQGYNQVIASNIWADAFEALNKQNPSIFGTEKNPIFNLTQSQMAEGGKDEKTQKWTVIQKPNPLFYQKLKAKNFGSPLIFIDDNNDNVVAAIKEGIPSEKFKNPTQLINSLAHHSIVITPTPAITFAQ